MAEIEVSNNKKTFLLRIILFVLAVVVAIGALTYGIVSFIQSSQKKEGTYIVTFDPSTEDKLYNQNIGLVYHVYDRDGQSAGQMYNAVYRLGCTKGSEIYSLLDSRTLYKDSKDPTFLTKNNIAALNYRPNEEVVIDYRLYKILTDAKAKNNDYYSIYSGLINLFWNYNLVDVSTDPYNNEDTRDALDLFVNLSSLDYDLELSSREENGSIMYYAKFVIPEESQAVLDANKEFLDEFTGDIGFYPILDLNILMDSYYLEYLCKEYQQEGYVNGMLFTYTGLRLGLSDSNLLEYNYPLFDYNDQYQAFLIGNITTNKAYSYSNIKSFPYYDYEELTYNVIKTNEGIVSHSSYYNYKSGYSLGNDLHTSLILKASFSLVELTYLNLTLELMNDLEQYKNLSSEYIYFVIRDDEKKIYTNQNDLTSLFGTNSNIDLYSVEKL